MELIPLCLLLCALPQCIPIRGGPSCLDNGKVYDWSVQRVPILLKSHTVRLQNPDFGGKKDGVSQNEGDGDRVCGIECQNALSPSDQAVLESILGYETVFENGTRTLTDVTLQGLNETISCSSSRGRRRRQVYGVDGRFVISDSHFTTRYPFSTAVRLSTGCSGVLVSDKHILTAAHCVHDGRGYLPGVRKLKVGFLQLKAKRGRGSGRGRRGRRGRKEGRKEGRRGVEEEDVNVGGGEEEVQKKKKDSGLDGGQRQNRRRGGDRQRWSQGKVVVQNAVDEETGAERAGGGGKVRKRGGVRRVQRSTEPKQQPSFRWTRVKTTHIPKGWIHTGNNTVAPDYDYALLELKRPIKQKHMELGLVPAGKPLPLGRVHFSGFDNELDRGRMEGEKGKVVYRFCSVTDESSDLLYQHCDAQQGASGAGVYIRLREQAPGPNQGKWQRRVIGVFSGHRWVPGEEGGQRDYNVAVRITPTKYAQICHWIHGDPSMCREA